MCNEYLKIVLIKHFQHWTSHLTSVTININLYKYCYSKRCHRKIAGLENKFGPVTFKIYWPSFKEYWPGQKSREANSNSYGYVSTVFFITSLVQIIMCIAKFCHVSTCILNWFQQGTFLLRTRIAPSQAQSIISDMQETSCKQRHSKHWIVAF